MSSDFLACIGGVLYERLEGRLGMLRSLGDTWFMAFRKEVGTSERRKVGTSERRGVGHVEVVTIERFEEIEAWQTARVVLAGGLFFLQRMETNIADRV
jgi:hypothetical protein